MALQANGVGLCLEPCGPRRERRRRFESGASCCSSACGAVVVRAPVALWLWSDYFSRAAQTVFVRTRATRYGSQLAFGRRSSAYPKPSLATCHGIRTEAPRSDTP